MEWRVLNRLLQGDSGFPMKMLEIKLSNSVHLDYSLACSESQMRGRYDRQTEEAKKHILCVGQL